ncbi:MarR family winged helix-turn-helix transcriptional regulator [Effusibacillus lacus]|uniref:MarR family transcriptional regulator n=1 Tax=Effusibacillus lacus TaxID=1348429 RepID=A0A292YSZ5_9BACL|nr:MarR family transcriptional regulator [Effusibacillus lacus]TCS73758.1 DNA-binding MarR family transcriptional regulator [Effusibacillus lacus]GAX92031.1 MarR family transcriptional regulator [Effusibacillus lacus]
MHHKRMDEYLRRFEDACLKTIRKMGAELSDLPELPPTQFLVLKILKEERYLMPTHLAEVLNVKPSAMTSLIDRMEKNGLVERYRIEEDRRVVYIKPTQAGLDALDKAEQTRREILVKYLSLLDETELDQLIRIYEKMALSVRKTSPGTVTGTDGKERSNR